MSPILPLSLALAILGQEPQTEAETKEAAAQRLAFMRASLEIFEVQRSDTQSPTYRLQAKPVMRFTNAVGTVKDGAIFLWKGDDDRPEAAVQVFWHNNGNWFQEFSSLSPRPIAAGATWRVGRGGVEFKPVPGAPRPADTPEQRLRQIRNLLSEITVEDQFERKTWQKLRLLNTPFARYGKPDGEVIDGALFAYVISTDPEVYVMIEARQNQGRPEWQFAFAPASIDPLKSSWKKAEVWSVPYREAWTDNTAPFYVHYFHRGAAPAPRPGPK